MFVAFNGAQSSLFRPHSGVPQGSVLGPLLFLVFINDLCLKLKSMYEMFADDLKIYRKILSLEDCLALQGDLNALDEWCELNDLQLNVSKCQYIVFTRKTIPNRILLPYRLGNSDLNRVYEVCDLGIIFDDRLKFDKHISSISTRAYRNLGFLMRITHQFTNPNCLRFLYFSIVRSVLEYGSQIWSPYQKTYVNLIERIQRKFTRFLSYKTNSGPSDYGSRLNQFNLLSLKSRRTCIDLLTLHKVLNNGMDSDFLQYINFRVSPFNSRLDRLFDPLNSKTDMGRYINPANRLMKTYSTDFNHIEIINTTHSPFKNNILSVLKDHDSSFNWYGNTQPYT